MKHKFIENFSDWLAGLIEGDGTIVTPEVERRNDGRKTYPHIQIAFNSKDLELTKKIVKIIGGGSITRDGNTIRLTWRSKADILKVIEIINGRMRTPKILRLYKLIDRYNEKEGTKIEKKGISEKQIQSSAWLSGMSDADSNFNIILTLRGNTYRAQRQWRLEIAQMTYHGQEQTKWAEEVSAYIESNLLSRHRIQGEKTYSIYKIIAHSSNSLNKMEEYLNKYPLRSSKYLDYQDWKKCGEIKEKTPENYKKIQDIKNGMNNKRAYFNWHHLETWDKDME